MSTDDAGSGPGDGTVADAGMADEIGVADPGAAQQRTDLAWTRSGLAVAVTVAIILRHLWPLTGDKAVAGFAVIAAGATLWTVTVNVGRSARHRTSGAPLGEPALPADDHRDPCTGAHRLRHQLRLGPAIRRRSGGDPTVLDGANRPTRWPARMPVIGAGSGARRGGLAPDRAM